MSKTIAIVIIVFWISFAFISGVFHYNGSDYQSLVNNFQMDSNGNKGIIDSMGSYLNLIWGTLKFFVQSLTISFPDVPFVFTLFIILMEIMSALVIIWMLLENLQGLLQALGGFLKFI